MTRDGLLTGAGCVSEGAGMAPDTAAGGAVVLDMMVENVAWAQTGGKSHKTVIGDRNRQWVQTRER